MAKPIKANKPTENPRPGKPVGNNDYLLNVQDVCQLLGICEPSAIKLMKSTGHAVEICRKYYVLDSRLYSFIKKLEGSK